jgi:hypothetical protein
MLRHEDLTTMREAVRQVQTASALVFWLSSEAMRGADVEARLTHAVEALGERVRTLQGLTSSLRGGVPVE